MHVDQRHAIALYLGFVVCRDVGGQQQLVGSYLHAVAREVENHFIAFVDAALEGINGAPQPSAPQVAGQADIKPGIVQHTGHQLGIVAGVPEPLHALVVVVTNHQCQPRRPARSAEGQPKNQRSEARGQADGIGRVFQHSGIVFFGSK